MSISIVLCTYNGAKYIEEQLESLKRQSIFINEYIICDDNSSDNTCIKIEKYKEKNPELNIKLFKNSVNKGVIKNFEFGLNRASGDYIAFCDQDDVWLPNKIKDSLNKMKKMEKEYGINMPLLVHTDLCVVDENLKIINNSFYKKEKIKIYRGKDVFKALFLKNSVVGCTMMINKTAKNLVLPFPKNIIMHDYWIALVVASIGRVEFLNKSTIKYRQHKDNLVGSKKYFSLEMLKKVFNKDFIEKSIQLNIIQNEELLKFKSGKLIKNNRWFIAALISIKNKDIFNMIRLGIHKSGLLRTLILYIYCILRKI